MMALPPRRSLLLLLALTPLIHAQCYDPTGLESTDSEFAPCPNQPTICCAINRDNEPGGLLEEGETQDSCLSNGLCQNVYVDQNGYNSTSYWRDFCTNSDWESGDCLSVCTQPDEVYKWGKFLMTPCDGTADSERWCCGDSRDCCSPGATAEAVTLAATFTPSATTAISSTTSSGLSSASQAGATGTGTPTASSTSKNEEKQNSNEGGSNESSGLSTGAKIGIGVGAAVGGIIIFVVGFFVAKYMHKKKDRPATPKSTEDAAEVPPKRPYVAEMGMDRSVHEMYGSAGGGAQYEIGGDGAKHEMAPNPVKHEMPA